jgi:hypothetical protein
MQRDFCSDNQVGFMMFHLTEEKLVGLILDGYNKEHFTYEIIKKTAV